MSTGIILYGPPGSGKDTITSELSRKSSEFTLFQRLKSGPGRTTGYRMTTSKHIEELSHAGEVLYRNSRYGAEYAIEKDGVSALIESGRIPVLHMGQVAGIVAMEAFPLTWVRVLLWCPHDVTRERCKQRGDKDLEARLRVWHETRQDLLNNADEPWTLVIPTDQMSATDAAQAINQSRLTRSPGEIHDIRKLVG